MAEITSGNSFEPKNPTEQHAPNPPVSKGAVITLQQWKCRHVKLQHN